MKFDTHISPEYTHICHINTLLICIILKKYKHTTLPVNKGHPRERQNLTCLSCVCLFFCLFGLSELT